jgi:uncharacterized protein YndB with AHSA1/START domain
MKGTLRQDDDRHLLRFERRYGHPPEKVWRALTEPDLLARWFPAAIEGAREPDARLRFVFAGGEGPPLEGMVRVFDPPRVLEYSWGDDVLRWELSPDGAGCRLVFTTTIAERSNAARDATGWHGCLDNLDGALEGRVPAPVTDFAALYRDYVLGFGGGAFPGFLGADGADGVLELLPNPALVGRVMGAGPGLRVGLLRATRDAETEEHTLAHDAYILVIEGSYLLRLGPHELPLPAGTELHVPGGGRVSGRVAAGTRLLYAVAGAPRAGDATSA